MGNVEGVTRSGGIITLLFYRALILFVVIVVVANTLIFSI